MKPTHSGTGGWPSLKALPHRLGGVLATASCLVLACAPPDRPARIPDDPTVRLLEVLAPDSTRQVSVDAGVWYRGFWSSRGPWAVHLLAVDMGRCELGLQTLPAPRQDDSPGGRERVSRLMRAAGDGVLAGVNADFFTPEGLPLGPEITGGSVRSPRARPVLAWRPGYAPWMGRTRVEGDSILHVGWPISLDAPDIALQVVSGFPDLLDGGMRIGDLEVSRRPSFADARHPRTAVGHDPATGWLYLVVVDGRQGEYSAGMSLPELADLMEALGITEALNLDGGGSSVMVIRGQVVSRPSDAEGERPVANALAVRKDPAYCTSK